jgi:hypothetical protein
MVGLKRIKTMTMNDPRLPVAFVRDRDNTVMGWAFVALIVVGVIFFSYWSVSDRFRTTDINPPVTTGQGSPAKPPATPNYRR